jgi:hypothetical protein
MATRDGAQTKPIQEMMDELCLYLHARKEVRHCDVGGWDGVTLEKDGRLREWGGSSCSSPTVSVATCGMRKAQSKERRNGKKK